MSSDLPWVLRYGGHLWLVVVFAVPALSMMFVWLRFHVRLRRYRRTGVEVLGVPSDPESSPEEGARLCLEGTLKVVEGTVRRFEDGSEAAAVAAVSWPPARNVMPQPVSLVRSAEVLALEQGERTFVLEGPLEIVVGSREYFLRRRLSRLRGEVLDRLKDAADDVGALLGRRRLLLLSLGQGDAVRVRGVLRPSGSLYRGIEWALVGDPELRAAASGESSLLAGYMGTPKVVRRPYWLVFRAALLTLALLAIAQVIVMEPVVFSAWGAQLADACALEESFPAEVTILAASPWRRDLLEYLNLHATRCSRQDWSPLRYKRWIALRHDLRSIQGKCSNAAMLTALAGDFDLAVTQGRRCADKAWAPGLVQVLYGLGEIERASDLATELDHAWLSDRYVSIGEDLAVRSRLEVELHLAAGRWSDAAAAARASAEALERHEAPARARELECIADAIEARAGKASAIASLRSRVTEDDLSFCPLLLADLLEGEQRVAFLRSRPKLLEARRGEADLLLIESRSFAPEDLDVESLVPIPFRFYSSSISDAGRYDGLTDAALAVLDEADTDGFDDRYLSGLHAAAAYFHLRTNDFEAAKRHIDRGLRDLHRVRGGVATTCGGGDPSTLSVSGFYFEPIKAIEALYDIETGDDAAAADVVKCLVRWSHPELDAVLGFRQDFDATKAAHRLDERMDSAFEGWRAASSRRGDEIGRWVMSCRTFCPDLEMIRLWAPVVEWRSDALLDALEAHDREQTLMSADPLLRDHLFAASFRRSVAMSLSKRGVRAQAVAESLQDPVDRFRAIALDRDLAMILRAIEGDQSGL